MIQGQTALLLKSVSLEQSMAENIEPIKFTPYEGEVGHSIVAGPTGSGKTVSAQLVMLWSVGHPGGSASVAQSDDNDGE